jgi:hypothetical protein
MAVEFLLQLDHKLTNGYALPFEQDNLNLISAVCFPALTSSYHVVLCSIQMGSPSVRTGHSILDKC